MSTKFNSMEQHLEDITACPICSDSFIDPRSLPCIHTFCLKCLERYGRFKQAGAKMSCPTCRTEFTIPETGFSGLPRNFFIGKMLQVKRLSSGEQTDPCEVCEAKKKKEGSTKTVAAVKYCVECEEKLCDNCSEDHLSHKMLRGHQVIDIDKTRGPDSSEVFRTTLATCLKHKDQAMTVFCNDCKTPICVVCYISSHKQHDCSDINDVIDEFRMQMTTDIGCLDEGVGKLRVLLDSIEQQKLNFLVQLNAARHAIAKKADELKQQVEWNKRLLLGELSAREQEVSKKLDSLSIEIKQHASFVESLKKYTKELSTKGAVCDIAREASALHGRVEELLKTDAIEKSRNSMHIIDVMYTETEQLSTSNLIGSVEVVFMPKQDTLEKKAFEITGGKAEIKMPVDYTPGLFAFKKRMVPQPTTPTLTKILQPRTNLVYMTSLNTQLFVTGRGINTYNSARQTTLTVYETTTFNLLGNIPVPGLQQVGGLTSCPVNNCLYASDASCCNVFRVEIPGKITKWGVSSRPAGLSVNTVNNVLVTLTDENRIREYTTLGSLIREIVMPHLSNPNHVIQLTNGQFVVSSDQGVCIVNANGQIASQYWGASKASVQLSQPMGLALTDNECIIVADRGLQGIIVINPSLTSACVLKVPANVALQGPWMLHFDEPRGRLYIGECNWEYQHKFRSQLQVFGRVLIFDNVFNVGNDLD